MGHCSMDSLEQVNNWVVPVRVVAVVSFKGRLLIDHVIRPLPEIVGATVNVLMPEGLTDGTSLMKSARALVVSG